MNASLRGYFAVVLSCNIPYGNSHAKLHPVYNQVCSAKYEKGRMPDATHPKFCALNVLILPSSVYNLSLLLVSTNLPLQLAQSQTCHLGQEKTNLNRNFSTFSVCCLGECTTFNRSIEISMLLSIVFASSSEAKQGQQLLLLRVKPYKNGCNTTFSHLYSFKNRIGPCLVSHFEGKVGLHSLPKSTIRTYECFLCRQWWGSQSAVQIPVYSVMFSVVKFLVLFQKSITQFLSSSVVICCYFTQRLWHFNEDKMVDIWLKLDTWPKSPISIEPSPLGKSAGIIKSSRCKKVGSVGNWIYYRCTADSCR